MRKRLERRRLTLRAAALCIVLVLLCGCLLPAFAEGTALSDSVPGQTQNEDEPVRAEDEEELPEESPDEPELLPGKDDRPIGDDTLLFPDEPEMEGPETPETPDEEPGSDSGAEKADEYFETTYLFWLSEKDEADGGLPYAEQTVGSGSELLLPEEPEMDGKTFRYWYSRDDEGTAVRFVPADEPLWPEADSECSLYAYFTADDLPEEPVFEDEIEIPGAADQNEALDDETPEEDSSALPEEDTVLPGEESDSESALPEEDTVLPGEESDSESALTDEEALPAEEEAAEDMELLAANRVESAAVFLLKAPTCLPGSNDPDQWAPDNSECRWIGSVNTRNATWKNNKNIVDNVQDYIVSWPDGSTESVWTLKPGSTYWSEVLDEIWDEYRDTIETATGIVGLTKSDLECITVTPYKISKNNGTEPDKHIDCTISVKSKKSFTARFNVRAPGEDSYTPVDSQEYQSGERVEQTTVKVEPEIDIGGVRYVFDGWYKEESGPVVDAPGEEQVTQDEWDEGYLPSTDELENGVVNFYAHYVLADIKPDTGVTVDFFALPLLLGAGAAALGCKNRKKEEDE